jgi:hypothetical protein
VASCGSDVSAGVADADGVAGSVSDVGITDGSGVADEDGVMETISDVAVADGDGVVVAVSSAGVEVERVKT